MSNNKTIICVYCGKSFEKPINKILRTEKLGQQHVCSRSCASKLTNDQRRCEPTTVNAAKTRRDKEKFPEKTHARYLVRQAIKTGKLIPLEQCELCNSYENIEAHHPDYNQPFLLLYLCKKCHSDADKATDKWIDLANHVL
ncbi:MAG: hypothetical protein JSW11_00365 [Candidatus Heimdallarchaeota archaeon]|nr:MAG: hypothetical protein JSW11_00365 [Candidatus Heimdallarchaeota archaeon]